MSSDSKPAANSGGWGASDDAIEELNNNNGDAPASSGWGQGTEAAWNSDAATQGNAGESWGGGGPSSGDVGKSFD